MLFFLIENWFINFLNKKKSWLGWITLKIKFYLNNPDFKTLIPLHSLNYLPVEDTRILNVDRSCNDLVFRGGVIGSIPKLDFPTKGALVTSPKPNITIFYIFHESHADVCLELHNHLQKGTGTYYC